MADDGYELRALDLDTPGIAALAGLLRVVYPGSTQFTEAMLRWQYVENPHGTAVGFNAWKDGALAAHYVTVPMRARVHGVEEKGLLSLNTATHPDHQGKGLFTRLATATYADGAANGSGFVIGVANANSTHGFTRKLGFQPVSSLDAMIGMGPLAFQHQVDAQYEAIWSPEALRWRLAHPAHRYRVKRTMDLDLVLSERSRLGARYILAALPRGAIAEGSLQPHGGGVPFKIWIGKDAAMRWRGRPYLNIPMRFRPSPLNLIFKDLTGHDRTLDAERVRFQAIDFDVL